MDNGYEVLYKGTALLTLAVEDDGFYTAMLITRTPDGEMRASGELGQFACALSARRYALAYGMAGVDQREPPLPDWPPIRMRAGRVAERARA